MTTIRSTLSEWGRMEVVPSRTARRVIGVLAFAVATALSAKVALPLPGTPVPFTFQPMLVILSGAVLGWRLGAASQLAYLAAGIAGAPVFAAGGGAAYLLGPTGGYLMAYPLAAAVAGVLAGGTALAVLGGLVAGLAVLYAGGIAWLGVLGGLDAAVAMGLRPFLLADLVKALLAAVLVLRCRDRARELFFR
jgi:biotin transport system substrate-specific component